MLQKSTMCCKHLIHVCVRILLSIKLASPHPYIFLVSESLQNPTRPKMQKIFYSSRNFHIKVSVNYLTINFISVLPESDTSPGHKALVNGSWQSSLGALWANSSCELFTNPRSYLWPRALLLKTNTTCKRRRLLFIYLPSKFILQRHSVSKGDMSQCLHCKRKKKKNLTLCHVLYVEEKE